MDEISEFMGREFSEVVERLFPEFMGRIVYEC